MPGSSPSSIASRSVALGLLVALEFVPACDRPQGHGSPPEASIRGPLADLPRGGLRPRPMARRLPVGPQLAIVPGEGIGPIRFGAEVATIERLMGAKCDDLTLQVCRYVAQAVEFELRDGVVVGILVHRQDRPVIGDPAATQRTYGVFHGFIPPGPGRPLNVMFGMHVPGVEEALGKALKVEPAPPHNFYSTREVRHYRGVSLEFDQIPEARVPVLGGIRVVKK